MSQIDTGRPRDQMDRIAIGATTSSVYQKRLKAVTSRPTHPQTTSQEEVKGGFVEPSRNVSALARPREADLAPLKGLSRDQLVARLTGIAARVEVELLQCSTDEGRLSLNAGYEILLESVRRLRLVRTESDPFRSYR